VSVTKATQNIFFSDKYFMIKSKMKEEEKTPKTEPQVSAVEKTKVKNRELMYKLIIR